MKKILFIFATSILLLTSCNKEDDMPSELSGTYIESYLHTEIRGETEYSTNNPDNKLKPQQFGGTLIDNEIPQGSGYAFSGLLYYKTETSTGLYADRVQHIVATMPYSKLVQSGETVQDWNITLFHEFYENKIALDPVTNQMMEYYWEDVVITINY